MKRLCLLISAIVLVISAWGQNVPYSSWYNEYTKEKVSYNLGNGTTFNGEKHYHKGQFLYISGQMNLPNGDKLSGTFDENLNLRGDGTYFVNTGGGYWGGYNKIVHLENGHLVDGSVAGATGASSGSTYTGTSSSTYNNSGSSSSTSRGTQCQGCHGSGRCQHCNGSGWVNSHKSKCSLCHGTGRCQSCAGVGKIY